MRLPRQGRDRKLSNGGCEGESQRDAGRSDDRARGGSAGHGPTRPRAGAGLLVRTPPRQGGTAKERAVSGFQQKPPEAPDKQPVSPPYPLAPRPDSLPPPRPPAGSPSPILAAGVAHRNRFLIPLPALSSSLHVRACCQVFLLLKSRCSNLRQPDTHVQHGRKNPRASRGDG